MIDFPSTLSGHEADSLRWRGMRECRDGKNFQGDES